MKKTKKAKRPRLPADAMTAVLLAAYEAGVAAGQRTAITYCTCRASVSVPYATLLQPR